MIAGLLCFASLVLVFLYGRKSLGSGLVALLGIGYAYGFLRANLDVSASHFIFDAAVLGLYLATSTSRARGWARYRSAALNQWLAALVMWPLLLFFVPRHDWMIQFVGLRGAIFFLPFLLIGARMEDSDFAALATGMAVLNTAEIVIALWQFTFGIQQWFPHSKVTEIIYSSNDVAGGAFRIPATFVASAAYGGMMAFTAPFLLAAWLKPAVSPLRRRLLEIGFLAAGVGVFLSASRTAAVLFAFSLVGIFTSFRLNTSHRVWIVALVLVVGWIVARDGRLQRFTTLSDTSMVAKRIQASVNSSLVDMLLSHPMGNGLGAGGTSIPYFLRERIQDRLIIENEYGLILIEQGALGLVMWLAFVIWAIVAAWPGTARKEYLGRFLLWSALAFSFGGAPMGTGLLTAIPVTPILLLACGWLIGKRREERLSARLARTSIFYGDQASPVLAKG
jgi:hypothetical protein